MGFSVIPLKPKDKRPFISWGSYQSKKATEAELSEWFTSGQNNLGIVTGSISGIAVVDCDNQQAVELAMKLGVGDGPRVITGKGKHFYFRYREGLRNFQKREDLPGIDLRADGGYVVGPPSIHPSGAIYQWEDIKKPLPEFPSWVIAKAGNQSEERKSHYQGSGKGSRNMTLARMAGVWVRELSLDEAIEMAFTWNSRNQPPLSESEVKTTVESIYKAEQRKRSEQANEQEDADPIKRAVSIESIKDRVKHLYDNGIPGGEELGWNSVSELYKPRRGEWTLVTGIPGHGKSEFLDNVIIRLALKGWKIAIFSAEKQPIEAHVASLAEKWAGIPFEETRYSRRMSETDLELVTKSLNRQICFVEFPDDEANLVKILATAKAVKASTGLDGLIIDPWNELEHNLPQNLSETLYISQSLTRVRRFARQNNVHVWVVAHPVKLRKNDHGEYDVPTPYDVSGSAHWRNKADMALAVYRHMTKEQQDKPVEIHVQKVRFKKVGKIGTALLRYDWETGRYADL